jgi:hypothetical protein
VGYRRSSGTVCAPLKRFSTYVSSCNLQLDEHEKNKSFQRLCIIATESVLAAVAEFCPPGIGAEDDMLGFTRGRLISFVHRDEEPVLINLASCRGSNHGRRHVDEVWC